MRKFTILGVTLTDYNAREALRRTEQFLREGALKTAAYISYTDLAAAARTPEQKEKMESLDLTLCVESAILEAAGIATGSRVREIEEQVYLREVCRRLAKGRRKVLLLTQKEEETDIFTGILGLMQPGLKIHTSRALEPYENNLEKLMNDLNEAAPDVILSALPLPVSLELMEEGRKYLNAGMWLALPEKKIPGSQPSSFLEKFRKKLFQKKVNQYRE